MKLTICISTLALIALFLNACAGPSSATAKSAQVPPARTLPPALDELKNATYIGINEAAGPITLQDGRWTGGPAAPGAAARPSVALANDFRVVGDLDGNGLDEVVVLLTTSAGGSGTLSYLAVMSRQNANVRNVATAALGDRVQLRSAQIEGGKLLARTVQAGVNDAACCPGDLVEWQWTLSGGRLNTPGPVRTGRLSLAALAGTEWVLRAWDLSEPAGAEPVTLAYDAGRFAGSSGCNRYTGGVTEGTTPGELSVGLLAGTRMACPEPQSMAESRFTEQLTGARTYGFRLGRLMISYARANGSRGTMLFDARIPPK